MGRRGRQLRRIMRQKGVEEKERERRLGGGGRGRGTEEKKFYLNVVMVLGPAGGLGARMTWGCPQSYCLPRFLVRRRWRHDRNRCYIAIGLNRREESGGSSLLRWNNRSVGPRSVSK